MVEIYKFTKERYSQGYFHTIKRINTERCCDFAYRRCYMFPYLGRGTARIYVNKLSLKGAYYIEYYDNIKHKWVRANFDSIYVFAVKTENIDELMKANTIIDSILTNEQKW